MEMANQKLGNKNPNKLQLVFGFVPLNLNRIKATSILIIYAKND